MRQIQNTKYLHGINETEYVDHFVKFNVSRTILVVYVESRPVKDQQDFRSDLSFKF